MRILILRTAAFLLALGLADAAFAGATLVSVSGKVEVERGTPPVWRAAHAGEGLAAGERIRTGAGARAELRLGDQRSARLYERSLLRIGGEVTKSGAVRSVELDAGASLFDLVRRALDDEFDVRTPEIIVSVKGTRFLVNAAPGADSASVFRGEVKLVGEGFDPLSIHPGFTGVLGEVEPTMFADPWDSWAASALAPEVAIKVENAAEIHGAVEAARESKEDKSLRDVPAEMDDSSGERDGHDKGAEDDRRPGEGILDDDSARDGRDGTREDGHDRDGSGRGEVEIDSVADVLDEQAQNGGTGSMLLDAVLNAEPDDFAGGGAASGNDDPGGGFSGGPGGATTQFPFTFDVQTSGGPNTVTVGFGAESVILDQNDVDDLQSGNRSPLGGFNSVLSTLDIDPIDLANYLDTLI
jgi:hypothetical protein